MQHSLKTNSEHDCQIYIACLASYNSGILHGKWIKIINDEDYINAEIKKVLDSSPVDGAEEFAIHDYQGFGRLDIDEYESVESVFQKAEFIEKYGDLGASVLSHFCGDLEDAQEAITDCYYGEYESEADFAGEIFDQCYPDIPKQVRWYFDEKLFARDLFVNDYYSVEVGGMVHVFSYH